MMRQKGSCLRGPMLALGSIACGVAEGPEILPEEELGSRPGYPATTSRLSSSLGGNLQKLCHATLVHPTWAITAAHCFSGVEPSARGALRDFGRGFSVSEVRFHPGAHQSRETRLTQVWAREDFVAADDLALVPIAPPVADVAPVARWSPLEACAIGAGIVGELGVLGSDGAGSTVDAQVRGRVAASSLLGPGHPGWLLAAHGPGIGPGDSGSGLTAAWDRLPSAATGCELAPEGNRERVLLGVVQDANPEQPHLPFGLVPLYGEQHAQWLAEVLAIPVPANPVEPPILPP